MKVGFSPLPLDAAKVKEAMGETKPAIVVTPDMCSVVRGWYTLSVDIDMIATNGLHFVLDEAWMAVADLTDGGFTFDTKITHTTEDKDAYTLEDYTISFDISKFMAAFTAPEASYTNTPKLNIEVNGIDLSGLVETTSYNIMKAPRLGRSIGKWLSESGVGFVPVDTVVYPDMPDKV